MRVVWAHYASGLIRELYQRTDRPGVVMMLEAADMAVVQAFVDALPLTKAGLIETEIIALGPFTMWADLFAKPA